MVSRKQTLANSRGGAISWPLRQVGACHGDAQPNTALHPTAAVVNVERPRVSAHVRRLDIVGRAESIAGKTALVC